jgi:hypothetical protein
MRNALVMLCLFINVSVGHGQLLLFENFSYAPGTTLISNGWVAHSGAGTNAQTVGSSGLSYTGYAGSGVGNSVSLLTSGEDVDTALTSAVTTGTAYASLLVRVDSATSAGDYFFHFIANSRTSNTFMGRLFAKKGANPGPNNLSFGISKASTATATPMVYSDSIYSFGTTYLVVVKYVFNTGSTTDDAVSLFVFADPTLPAVEPATPTVGPVTTTQSDATSLPYIALRQGTASSSPLVTVDAIRVGLAWNDAPLPVQLASFTGTSTSVGCVRLNWTTMSEVNNYGFSVQRSRDRIAIIDVPNSFVPGNGTTNERHEYAFRECGVSSGTWYYRLRQIDLDGSEHFSEWIHVEVLGVTSVGENVPKQFALKQNFPNPFNPETTIHFSVEREGRATLRVFNIIGQPVAVLYDDVAQPSTQYSVKFDGKQLTSGIYFYKLESGNQSAMKKLMLLK